MDYIQTANKQVDKFGAGQHGFQAGVPGVSLATALSPAFCDDVMMEVVNVLLAGGVAPAAATRNQLLQALRRMFGGNYRVLTTGATVLVADDAGDVYVDASGGNVTITMPATDAAGGARLPFRFYRTDTSGNSVTISRAGANVIFNRVTGATSISLRVGEELTMNGNGLAAGAGVWRAVNGRLGFVTSAGAWCQFFPGGYMLQGITGTAGAVSDTTLSFAVTFPTAILGRVATARNGSGSSGTLAQIGAETTSAINVGTWRGGTPSRVSEVVDVFAFGN